MIRGRFIVLGILLTFLLVSRGFSLCKPRFVNPVTDVCWSCIFPIRIGGITVFSSDAPDADALTSPVCSCPGPAGIPVIGLSVSFWEPYRIIEVVADPWCMVAEGVDMGGVTSRTARGTLTGPGHGANSPHYFAQAHHIVFPVWGILDLLTDVPCVESGGWDVAYVTELDPLWQSDLESLILNPEALVFGNAALQLACTADAVSAAFGLPRDELFWCMGQWGSAYPLTGRIMTGNPVLGAAAVAGRLLYKLNREMLLCDRAVSPCSCVRTPIWIKSHYRLQIVRPKTNTGGTIRIGQPSPLWEAGQAPPLEEGTYNFAFIVFRKVNCCLIWTP